MKLKKVKPLFTGIIIVILLSLAGCPAFMNTGKNNQTTGNSPATTTTTTVTEPDPYGRPAYNTGTGFFVADKKLFDANGMEFIINGVNTNHWWGTDDNTAAIPNIKAANANAVRCVFGKRAAQGAVPDDFEEWYDNANCYTTEQRKAVVEEYIKYHIVPVVEFHNATGSNDTAKVMEAVNFWLGESWVKTYEKYVMINITNEWANSGNYTLWRDTYKNAVQTLRSGGINNTLIIDSIQWAQSIIDKEYYDDIFDADPQKNVVFSFHMYEGWLAPGDNRYPDSFDGFYHIDTGLDYLKTNLKAPVICGEFNYLCYVDGHTNCPDDILLDNLTSQKTGWFAWMWYNSTGNQENMVYSADSNMYTDFGKTVAGYLKNSVEATVFTTPLPELPEIPVINPDPNWNPGGLTVSYFDVSDGNPWWIEVKMDNILANTTGDVSYIEMENINSPGKVRLQFRHTDDYHPVFYNNSDLKSYIGVNTVFWLYAVDGSVARTLTGTLVQGNHFDIDTTY